MNKTAVFMATGAMCLSVAVSVAQTVETTNKEGSAYRFEKKVHLEATPVESQGNSGTCWSFSTLSFFETELSRMGKDMISLSEMYIVYHAYLGKAEQHFRTDGHTNFDEGGAFHDIPWVISRFGVVPHQAYDGLGYGSSKHSHAELAEVLKGALGGLMKARNELKENDRITPSWKKAMRGILDAYLGKVPENTDEMKFDVDGKTYTPTTYRDALGLQVEDYVSLTSFSNHPWYASCRLAIADNWAWGTSYNVPLNDLWEAAAHALSQGYSFAWGSDVSEDYFSFRSALAIVPKDKSTIAITGANTKNFSDAGATKRASCFMEPVEEETITQEKRQEAYDGKQTTDDHGMHVVGLYNDQNGTPYLLVKNSWGKRNDCGGYLYASKAYFDYKTINIYLHKDALPKNLRKKLRL